MNEITARTVQDIAKFMDGQTPRVRADAVLALFDNLPVDQQKSVARKTGAVLDPPSDATRDWIWLIIVGTFAGVLAGSAIVLGLAVFWETKANTTYFAKIATIVTVFTSVLAFLSGLLAPSPIKGAAPAALIRAGGLPGPAPGTRSHSRCAIVVGHGLKF